MDTIISIKCKNCGNDCWSKEVKWNREAQEFDRVLECTNCLLKRPHHRRSKKPLHKPNHRQRQVVEYLKEQLLWKWCSTLAETHYEIKQLRLQMIPKTRKASVVIETGLKNDEGKLTMMYREHRHFFIGPRGGVELINAKKKSKSRGLFNAVWAQV